MHIKLIFDLLNWNIWWISQSKLRWYVDAHKVDFFCLLNWIFDKSTVFLEISGHGESKYAKIVLKDGEIKMFSYVRTKKISNFLPFLVAIFDLKNSNHQPKNSNHQLVIDMIHENEQTLIMKLVRWVITA